MKTPQKHKTFEEQKWIDFMRPFYFTIQDFESMDVGEEMKMLCLDRNVFDIAETCNFPDHNYLPRIFFRNNIVTLIKEGDLTKDQKLIFYFGSQDSGESYERSLEIEYKEGYWYPLENGYLPENDCQNIFELLGKKTFWEEFPENTPLGFRGPMIPWYKIESKNIPWIYYRDEYQTEESLKRIEENIRKEKESNIRKEK